MWMTALSLIFSFQAATPPCLHDANEPPAEQARRREALIAARAINTVEANGTQNRRYLDAAGVLRAIAADPRVARIPLSFAPGTDLLPGWTLKLRVTESGYWFMIKDKIDPCGFAYISDEAGVIYRSEPIR